MPAECNTWRYNAYHYMHLVYWQVMVARLMDDDALMITLLVYDQPLITVMQLLVMMVTVFVHAVVASRPPEHHHCLLCAASLQTYSNPSLMSIEIDGNIKEENNKIL